jgi:Secretion system C-terminal sorting domain
MMKRTCLLVCCGLLHFAAMAQYAPQAGLPGSTAISASSSLFTGWATYCSVNRGYMDIANPAGGYASVGDSADALGAPDLNVVSLGDSGVATLSFANPIIDGPGADFAVFENGFPDTDNDSLAFLELGFVEVSSDGTKYVRFPATSNTEINVQIANGNYMNACDLNDLAGKYIGMYGTPFDLSELADTPGLDVHNIRFVRIVDVIGSISGHSSFDHNGRVVNDPYPTAFPSCGFDLDAVGVINQSYNAVAQTSGPATISLFPNPATDELHIKLAATPADGVSATITSITGMALCHILITAQVTSIPLSMYAPGLYFIEFRDSSGNRWTEQFIKR